MAPIPVRIFLLTLTLLLCGCGDKPPGLVPAEVALRGVQAVALTDVSWTDDSGRSADLIVTRWLLPGPPSRTWPEIGTKADKLKFDRPVPKSIRPRTYLLVFVDEKNAIEKWPFYVTESGHVDGFGEGDRLVTVEEFCAVASRLREAK